MLSYNFFLSTVAFHKNFLNFRLWTLLSNTTLRPILREGLSSQLFGALALPREAMRVKRPKRPS